MRGPIYNVPPIQRGYPVSPRPNLSPPPIQNRPPPQPVYLQPPVNRPPPNFVPNFHGPSTPTFQAPPPIYNARPYGVPVPQGGYPMYASPPRGIYSPFQQIPGMLRHPQQDLNMNFDYEQANFLTDTKIVENSVFCVICG